MAFDPHLRTDAIKLWNTRFESRSDKPFFHGFKAENTQREAAGMKAEKMKRALTNWSGSGKMPKRRRGRTFRQDEVPPGE